MLLIHCCAEYISWLLEVCFALAVLLFCKALVPAVVLSLLLLLLLLSLHLRSDLDAASSVLLCRVFMQGQAAV